MINLPPLVNAGELVNDATVADFLRILRTGTWEADAPSGLEPAFDADARSPEISLRKSGP